MPEVETSDPTECEFVDSHTGYGWDPSTMLSGTAFHSPTGQTHAITKDCWAGAGVITLLRVIAARPRLRARSVPTARTVWIIGRCVPVCRRWFDLYHGLSIDVVFLHETGAGTA